MRQKWKSVFSLLATTVLARYRLNRTTAAAAAAIGGEGGAAAQLAQLIWLQDLVQLERTGLLAKSQIEHIRDILRACRVRCLNKHGSAFYCPLSHMMAYLDLLIFDAEKKTPTTT